MAVTNRDRVAAKMHPPCNKAAAELPPYHPRSLPISRACRRDRVAHGAFRA